MVTDPYSPQRGGESMGKVAADIVTLSGPAVSATDIDQVVKQVAGEPRIVAGPGEYEIADVLIAGVATATEPGEGARNTAYVLRSEDLVVCHLGAPESKLSDKQVEAIGSIDVLLLPVGGGGSLGPDAASEVVSQLEPSVVVPMRYRSNGAAASGAAALEPVDGFLRVMGTKEFVPEPKLSVTKSSLPADIRIVVLENRRI